MIKLLRTNTYHPDFAGLTKLLDAVLEESDGDEHPFYAQFNKPEDIKYALVGYADNTPVGCGAIKLFSDKSAEIKRMYVLPEFRGKGYARTILRELEVWARELNFSECILETGKKQIDAVSLYLSSGYKVIPNYGQYEGVELSVCMKKSVV